MSPSAGNHPSGGPGADHAVISNPGHTIGELSEELVEAGSLVAWPANMNQRFRFRYVKSSPAIIRLAVMISVRFPLPLHTVEDLLHERGNDICPETVRFWWNRYGPMFAAEIPRRRVDRMRDCRQWRWNLDEMPVKINGETHDL